MKGEVLSDRRAVVVHHSVSGEFAIRRGKWKLVLSPDDGDGSKKDKDFGMPILADKRGARVQLYNMETDVYEEKNRCSQYPEVVCDLTKFQFSMLKECHSGYDGMASNPSFPGICVSHCKHAKVSCFRHYI